MYVGMYVYANILCLDFYTEMYVVWYTYTGFLVSIWAAGEFGLTFTGFCSTYEKTKHSFTTLEIDQSYHQRYKIGKENFT